MLQAGISVAQNRVGMREKNGQSAQNFGQSCREFSSQNEILQLVPPQ
jgi:hypothetical protein